MVLHICIVYNPRKRHFDFGFKCQGLEHELYIVSLLGFFFLGGGGENVKRKVCILQCFCTIFGSKGQGQHAQICILNFASLPHTKCSLTIIF